MHYIGRLKSQHASGEMAGFPVCCIFTLRVLPHAVSSPSSRQIEGTKKLLNKDLGELISKMRLAQQNAVTSLKEECLRQMLAAAHTLALDSKNLLDAVDQARVRANLAQPRPASQDAEDCGE